MAQAPPGPCGPQHRQRGSGGLVLVPWVPVTVAGRVRGPDSSRYSCFPRFIAHLMIVFLPSVSSSCSVNFYTSPCLIIFFCIFLFVLFCSYLSRRRHFFFSFQVDLYIMKIGSFPLIRTLRISYHGKQKINYSCFCDIKLEHYLCFLGIHYT